MLSVLYTHNRKPLIGITLCTHANTTILTCEIPCMPTGNSYASKNSSLWPNERINTTTSTRLKTSGFEQNFLNNYKVVRSTRRRLLPPKLNLATRTFYHVKTPHGHTVTIQRDLGLYTQALAVICGHGHAHPCSPRYVLLFRGEVGEV